MGSGGGGYTRHVVRARRLLGRRDRKRVNLLPNVLANQAALEAAAREAVCVGDLVVTAATVR